MNNVPPIRTTRATEQQLADLRRSLEQENWDRRMEGSVPFDIEEKLQREVVDFEHALYMDRLRPLIEDMFVRYPGLPGTAGRIVGHIHLYDAAICALRDTHGIVPPHPIRFDIIRFLELYEQGELDQWGGAFRVTHQLHPDAASASGR